MGKRKDLKIIVEPKYIDGKPTLTLLEGTYCTACGAFLAPPDATDDERINKAIEHIDICPGKQRSEAEREV